VKAKYWLFVTFTILILSASQAYCGDMRGHDLIEGWQALQRSQTHENPSDIDITKSMRFVAYIMGVMDTLNALGKASKMEYVNAGQCAFVVGKYLDAHPEEWNKPAILLVLSARQEAGWL
jgi:hypothetical protein